MRVHRQENNLLRKFKWFFSRLRRSLATKFAGNTEKANGGVK